MPRRSGKRDRNNDELGNMSLYKLKGTSGSVINQSFPFGESIVLGSADDCDVQIDEPGIAARHAEIRLLDNHTLQLKDLGFGTLLNGEPVSETLLGSGDEIRITCPDQSEDIVVEPVVWKNITYSMNEENHEIEENVIGKFTEVIILVKNEILKG